MKTAILKHMGIKKIIAVVFAGIFFNSIAFAAAPVVVVLTAPDRCPPCRQMEPDIAALIAQGYQVRTINPDAMTPEDTALINSLRPRITSIPATIVLDGNREINRIEGRASRAQLDRLLADNNMRPQPPVTTPPPRPSVTPPRPSTAGNRPTTPQRPPSIPVPPAQLPDSAFTAPLNCSMQTSGEHRGEYRCQYVNSEGVLMQFYVGTDRRDFFDTIANLARNNEILLADPRTGAVRPMSRPPSQLPSTLPPVPGDPGYVPPRPRPPTPPRVIPGNDDWTPVPTPPARAPIVAANGRGYIVTFPGMIPIIITGAEIDAVLQASRTDIGTRAEIALMLAAQRNMVPAPVAPGSTPPAVRPPANTVPATPAPDRHVLGTPKLVDGVWEVKVQICTDTTCITKTIRINNSSTVSTPEAAAAAALRQSVEAPAPRPRSATVTPNAPPPRGAVTDPFTEPSEEEMRRIEAETRRIQEENRLQDERNIQRGGNSVIRPRP